MCCLCPENLPYCFLNEAESGLHVPGSHPLTLKLVPQSRGVYQWVPEPAGKYFKENSIPLGWRDSSVIKNIRHFEEDWVSFPSPTPEGMLHKMRLPWQQVTNCKSQGQQCEGKTGSVTLVLGDPIPSSGLLAGALDRHDAHTFMQAKHIK